MIGRGCPCAGRGRRVVRAAADPTRSRRGARNWSMPDPSASWRAIASCTADLADCVMAHEGDVGEVTQASTRVATSPSASATARGGRAPATPRRRSGTTPVSRLRMARNAAGPSSALSPVRSPSSSASATIGRDDFGWSCITEAGAVSMAMAARSASLASSSSKGARTNSKASTARAPAQRLTASATGAAPPSQADPDAERSVAPSEVGDGDETGVRPGATAKAASPSAVYEMRSKRDRSWLHLLPGSGRRTTGLPGPGGDLARRTAATS